jgi:pimeloyl-ACP methyl ester carboxylesterase
MNKVLFLQSWYSNVTDNWYPWLETELQKKDYKTFFLDLPEMRKDQPNIAKMLTQIEAKQIIDKNTIVIGHSLGTLLGMRLAEKHPFKKLILVSGWDFDDLTEGHKLFLENKDRSLSHKKKCAENLCGSF